MPQTHTNTLKLNTKSARLHLYKHTRNFHTHDTHIHLRHTYTQGKQKLTSYTNDTHTHSRNTIRTTRATRNTHRHGAQQRQLHIHSRTQQPHTTNKTQKIFTKHTVHTKTHANLHMTYTNDTQAQKLLRNTNTHKTY